MLFIYFYRSGFAFLYKDDSITNLTMTRTEQMNYIQRNNNSIRTNFNNFIS